MTRKKVAEPCCFKADYWYLYNLIRYCMPKPKTIFDSIRTVILAYMLLLVFGGFLSACRSNHAVQVAADYVSASDVRPASYAGNMPRFKALLYYSDQVEEAHRQFASQAIEFFHRLTYGEGWILDVSSRLEDSAALGQYNLIIMPNAAPETSEERALFEEYMENGGGWLGFHGAGYNDLSTGWDWFHDFMGGVRFLCNNWPPQPALVDIEGHDHAITRNLPDQYVAPATEFYQWQPDPRYNPDIRILVSLSPRNFPLGLKDIVFGGDFPVVWSNTRYRMVYINMGHGDECFSDATQNLLFVNALRYVASTAPQGNPFHDDDTK